MGLGTAMGGWRIVKTMGMRITAEAGRRLRGRDRRRHHARAQRVDGIPVSTTHVITGAIAGVGFTRGTRGALGHRGIHRLGVCWTIPMSGIVAALVWYVLRIFVHQNGTERMMAATRTIRRTVIRRSRSSGARRGPARAHDARREGRAAAAGCSARRSTTEPHAANERLGIPGYRDGRRSARRCARGQDHRPFPVDGARRHVRPGARAARRRAMGVETSAAAAQRPLPRASISCATRSWGRAQETYGEDPHHLGVMGAAFVEGVQQHVVASVKHYAVNSIENTRFTMSANPPSARCARSTCRTPALHRSRRRVGERINRVNGEWCENAHPLRDILKGEWGFDGFVESDWLLGMHDMPVDPMRRARHRDAAPEVYGRNLLAAVESGTVPVELVDDAVRRVLRIMIRFGIFDGRAHAAPSVIACAAHTDLAREGRAEVAGAAAQRAICCRSTARGCDGSRWSASSRGEEPRRSRQQLRIAAVGRDRAAGPPGRGRAGEGAVSPTRRTRSSLDRIASADAGDRGGGPLLEGRGRGVTVGDWLRLQAARGAGGADPERRRGEPADGGRARGRQRDRRRALDRARSGGADRLVSRHGGRARDRGRALRRRQSGAGCRSPSCARVRPAVVRRRTRRDRVRSAARLSPRGSRGLEPRFPVRLRTLVHALRVSRALAMESSTLRADAAARATVRS